MAWEWEEFTLKSNYRSEMVRVSLNARGHFSLNQKAVEVLGDPQAVVLLFDRTSRMIGIRPSSPDVEHAYELKRSGTTKSYQIGARSFCAFYRINVGDPILFRDPQIEDGMIVLSLDNVTEMVRRARLDPLSFRYSEAAAVRPQPVKFSTLLRMRDFDDE